MTSSLSTTSTTNDLIERAARHAVMNATVNEVERRLMLVGAKLRHYGDQNHDFPTKHHFVPGMYCREIFMPKGSIVTSYIHRHEHPYVVSQGDCWVFNDQLAWDRITAPYFGVTKAGTRRLLVMIEDTVWTTFHITNTTDIEAVEREVFILPDNPFYPKEAA